MFWTVKINGDPNETLETEETEQQFLIKWKGWSHINNTWETDKTISECLSRACRNPGMPGSRIPQRCNCRSLWSYLQTAYTVHIFPDN